MRRRVAITTAPLPPATTPTPGFRRHWASRLTGFLLAALVMALAIAIPGNVVQAQNAPVQTAPAQTQTQLKQQAAPSADAQTSPSALQFPKLTGRVVDAAHILDDAARARIAEKLAAYEAKTSDQVVVATVPSLDGLTIEDYANRLFRQWGIGTRDKNNGALLLVAPNERKVRIEVGYGVEGGLTDAMSSVIINSAIIPKFRQGDFAGGVEAGANAMVDVLSGDAETWNRQAEATSEDDSVSILAVIFYLVVLLVFIRIMSRMAGGGGPGGGNGRNGMHRSPGGRWGPVFIPPVGGGWGGGFGGSGGGFGGGGFSGGGGSSGGGGASGSW